MEAQVLVSYGAHGIVQSDQGGHLPCMFRRKVGRPCCGDFVMVRRAHEGAWVVDEILARKNQFVRADQHARKHIVAANLDRVVIVIATKPLPSRDLLDRYLVAVHSLGITPVIVLNKSELTYDQDDAGGQTIDRLEAYSRLGYQVFHTSCKTDAGLGQLGPALANGTSILVGQSGVGKSSLARILLPDIEIQTGALSNATGKGTHTTTTTIAYALPGGGQLIDSPGVWEYGLWKVDDQEIALGFPEFRTWLGGCRFNDCVHISEPGCAVKGAVDAGRVLPWRYASYARLFQQNKDQPQP